MIRYLAGTNAGAFPIIGFSPTAGVAFANRNLWNAPQCSVDLQRQRFDDRRPESNIRCERPGEFFGV